MTQVAQLTEAPAPDRTEPPVSAAGMLEALEQLPPRQQEVLRLKFQTGLSYRDIAEVTGLSSGNVGLIIHNSLRAMRESLQPAVSPPADSSRIRT